MCAGNWRLWRAYYPGAINQAVRVLVQLDGNHGIPISPPFDRVCDAIAIDIGGDLNGTSKFVTPDSNVMVHDAIAVDVVINSNLLAVLIEVNRSCVLRDAVVICVDAMADEREV